MKIKLKYIIIISLIIIVSMFLFKCKIVTINSKWTETASVFSITSDIETYQVELKNGNCYKVSLKDYEKIKLDKTYFVYIDHYTLNVLFCIS